MDDLTVALRLATYLIISLVAGAPAFLWLALGADRGRLIYSRPHRAQALLAIAGAGLALLSLAAATAAMAGTPLLPVDWQMVMLIVSATASGKAIVARAALMLLLVPLALAGRLRIACIVAALATATLAWSGHAAASEGMAGTLHLLADIVHLWAAAIWIGGMACLLLSLARPERDTIALLRAFAVIGSVIVALLIVTGIINIAMILGLEGILALSGTLYGRLLGLKIAAFLFMLLLAANNRFRLVPRYEEQADGSRSHLRRAIAVEITLGLAVLLLVAWLGTIDPTAPA